MQSSLEELPPGLPPACSTVKENTHRLQDRSLWGLKVFCHPVEECCESCGTAGLCRYSFVTRHGLSSRLRKQHQLRHRKQSNLQLFLPLLSSPDEMYLSRKTKVESHKKQVDSHIFQRWLTFPKLRLFTPPHILPMSFLQDAPSLSFPGRGLSSAWRETQTNPLEWSLSQADEGSLFCKSTPDPFQTSFWAWVRAAQASRLGLPWVR